MCGSNNPNQTTYTLLTETFAEGIYFIIPLVAFSIEAKKNLLTSLV